MTSPRLYVAFDLAGGANVDLPQDQAHYLRTVLRLGAGAGVRVFNGRDGEWDAQLVDVGKRSASLTITAQRRGQASVPDVHLLFAPLKKTRTDFLVEKATELGVAALRPVFTRHTNADRVNVDRLTALAREAAEQTERLDVPDIAPPTQLGKILDVWAEGDAGRRLIFCDEGAPRDTAWSAPNAGAPALADVLKAQNAAQNWAILIGPEGGFSPDERDRLRSAPFAYPVSLGPRILRAETAAIAALTVFQAVAGDWAGD